MSDDEADHAVVEPQPDLLILTDDGLRLKCFSDPLVRNSSDLRFMVALAKKAMQDNPPATASSEGDGAQQAEQEGAAEQGQARKRQRSDATSAVAKFLVQPGEEGLTRLYMPGESGKAWAATWQQYDDRQPPPPITWDTAEAVLHLAHKYQLARAVGLCVEFVSSNMMDLNLVENRNACIIRWLAISKQREQEQLHRTLRVRLREYCAVVQAWALARDASTRRYKWRQEAGPHDPEKIQQQAVSALQRVSEDAGGAAELKAVDEETQYVVMRMAAKVMLKLASRCTDLAKRCSEQDKKLRLAKCADCQKDLACEAKSYCSRCLHNKLYKKAGKGDAKGGKGGKAATAGEGEAKQPAAGAGAENA